MHIFDRAKMNYDAFYPMDDVVQVCNSSENAPWPLNSSRGIVSCVNKQKLVPIPIPSPPISISVKLFVRQMLLVYRCGCGQSRFDLENRILSECECAVVAASYQITVELLTVTDGGHSMIIRREIVKKMVI